MTKYVIEWPDTYRALPDVIDDLHRNGFNGTAMVLQQAEPLPDCGLVGCELSPGHIHRRSAEPPHSDDAPAPVLRDQLVAAVKEAGQLVSQRHIMHALSAQTEAIRAAQNVAGRAVLEFAESLADRLQPEKPEVKAETCHAGKNEEGVTYRCDLRPEAHPPSGTAHRDPEHGWWRKL